jgi:hypothetical protein
VACVTLGILPKPNPAMRASVLSPAAPAPASWSSLTQDVLASLALGLRDGLAPRLLLSSITIWLGAFLLWALLFLTFRSEAWALAQQGLQWLWQGLAAAVFKAPVGVVEPSGVASAFPGFASVVLLLLAFALLVSLTVRIALELLLMARIQRQCLLRYPQLATGVPGSLRASLRSLGVVWGKLIVGGLLCLMVPVVGGFLFFALGAYLNARSLVNDALEGVATPQEQREFIRSRRFGLALLGLAMTLLMLVPLAGLLAPTLMGASVCHLALRQVAAARSNLSA